MNRKQKRMLYRIIAGLVLLIAARLLPIPEPWNLIPFLLAYAAVGYQTLLTAGKNIAHGQVFDENFLMSIASLGAFFTGDYSEGVVVMLFSQVGELFESYATSKSRKSIASLMDIRPDVAKQRVDGQIVTMDPEEIQVGDSIVIEPGDRVPLDGVILSGSTSIDTSALTGESLPRDCIPGDAVMSGTINLSGVIECRVTKPFSESTVSKILDLVENAASEKADTEKFITKFARYYTPVVVIAAVLLAVLPPLFTGGNWGEWIHRALIFLVVSCPCALVISVPLSFFGGIGGASKDGILIKGGNHMEMLAQCKTVVMDKTGTLTHGRFEVTNVIAANGDAGELLQIAALAEIHSNHPIAVSIRNAAGAALNADRAQDVTETSGHGVSCLVDGHRVLAGNAKLMAANGIECESADSLGSVVYVARDGQYLGRIEIADTPKPDARQAIASLKALGVEKIVMLTGDNRRVAEVVSRELGIDEFHAELLPADKVERMRQLAKNKSGSLAFVGDGINDAPVLALADVGIAMGGLGSDAAIEAADVVIMDDKPSKLADAISISRKTLGICKQNIIFALGVKGLVLLLGALGIAGMWGAVFADVGVSVICILNAMRCLKKMR